MPIGIITKAEGLFHRFIIAAKSLRTVRVDWVIDDFFSSPIFSVNSFQDHRLSSAYLEFLGTSPVIFRHITHLTLLGIIPEVIDEITAAVTFPSLVSFSGTLEIFAALSYHHPLQTISLCEVFSRDVMIPCWIITDIELQELSYALGRVPAKAICIGVDLGEEASRRLHILNRILDAAPGLESLAVTITTNSSTSVLNDITTLVCILSSHDVDRSAHISPTVRRESHREAERLESSLDSSWRVSEVRHYLVPANAKLVIQRRPHLLSRRPTDTLPFHILILSTAVAEPSSGNRAEHVPSSRPYGFGDGFRWLQKGPGYVEYIGRGE